MENKERGAEMWAQGTGTLTYTGCTVLNRRAKAASSKAVEVKTKEMAATSKGPDRPDGIHAESRHRIRQHHDRKCTVAGLSNTFP